MRQALLAATIFALSASLPTQAAEHWIHLTTPHFELYTTNSPKQAAAVLNEFEQVRYFFLENSRTKSAPDAAVRVIAFRSEKEFKPYRTNEGASAYYVRSRKVDYIVMQDLSSDHHQAALHEYTHLVVEHLQLKFPIWLNEGLADLYSSLEPKGDRAVVGRPLEGRSNVLTTQRWLDLKTLFAVDSNSPYYNERDKMSIFYAQSWALTHMIMLGKDYRPGSAKFLAAVAAGRPAAEALQSIFGKTLPQITADLHAYLLQTNVQGFVFDVKLSKSDLEPQVSEPSDFEVDLALADLLACQRKTLPEASQRLSQLAAQHPDSADIQESLAYLAWQQGNTARARESFKLAYDKGGKNPEMLFHYSQLLRDSGASAKEVLPVLERAVALKPDYTDAWFNLGLVALSDHQAGVALDALGHITKVIPDRAFTLFSAQAYCYMELKSPQQARASALQAKPYANTPEQNLQISRLLQYADSLDQKPHAESTPPLQRASAEQVSPEQPALSKDSTGERPRDVPSVRGPANMQHAQGMVRSFECRPKAARLHVFVNSQEKIFQLDEPDKVVVRHGDNGFLDINCGSQKPFRVDVFYVPSTAPGVDGSVVELVF